MMLLPSNLSRLLLPFPSARLAEGNGPGNILGSNRPQGPETRIFTDQEFNTPLAFFY